MYHQFYIKNFYVLPTQSSYVFCVDIRTNSDYFPLEYYLTDIYNKNLNFYTSVVTICTTSLTLRYSTFCPHSVFMFICVWNLEKIAIISLYNIKWLGCITDV